MMAEYGYPAMDAFEVGVGRAAPVWPQDGLLRRAADGDGAALAALYDAHHGGLRRFARGLLGEAQAAEDLVQEVFVALPGLLGRYRGEGALGSFLMGIAARRASRHVRAARRRRAAMARLAAEVPPDEPGEVAATPEDAAARAQLRAALTGALDRLPMRQRLAFVLCVVEERSSEEAAAILGVPAATVRSRVMHARRKLRARLARVWP